MVPNGWEVKSPSKLFKLFSGFAFKSSDAKESGAKWLKIANVGIGEIKWDADSFLPEHFLLEHKKYLLTKGDIVVALTRPTLGNKLKVARLTKNSDTSLLNQRVAKIVCKDNVDSEFTFQVLRSDQFAFRINVGLLGTDPPNLSVKVLEDFTIPVPPLPEQRKIAQILSTWDRGIATTEKLIDASKLQKKALMQQLLTGKKRLVNPETGKAFEGEWKFSQFNELYKVANNKATQVKSGEYLESGRTPIVDQGKSIVGGYTNNEITYKDLPVIVFGDHTRIVKWVDFEFAQGADGTQVLKSHKSMDDKFAYYVLLNTDIPNLGYSRHMRELKERDFKYPISKVEQQKIASVLTAADKEIELLEAKLSHFKQEKKALMQQLLTGKRRVKVPETEAA